MTITTARASESNHWYCMDGTPKYTVIGKNGKERPTTLRDGRKLALVPSVTTILKVLAKPGLDAWKLNQMLLAALTLTRLDGESEQSFIDRINLDSKETGKKAAELGTHIHASIERHFKGDRNNDHPEIAWAFDKAICEHFKTHPHQPWHVERSFANTLGYGGKIDLYCEPDTAAPHGIVLDSKTKEFGPDDKVESYDEQLLQLSAYRHGLGLPHARCANVFVSRTHPGLIKVVEWPEEELQRGWKMFQLLLSYWQLKNSFGVQP